MNTDILVKVIVEKGVNKANISMLPVEVQIEVYEKAASILMRQGKKAEALAVLECLQSEEAKKALKSFADNAFSLQDYATALRLYEKIGNAEMVNFIKENKLA